MVKHALIYFVAFALPGVLGFFSFGVYTHVLTPTQYGVYSVGTSVAFLLGSVCFGWIRFSVGRYQSEAPDTNFIPFALICFAITGVVLGPPAVLGTLRFVSLTPVAIAAVLVMTLGQAMFDITQEIRKARHQSLAFTRASVLRSLLSFVLTVSVAASFHLGSLVLFGIGGSFFLMALAFLVSNRHALTRESPQVALIGRFLRYGMPLSLSGLVFAGNATLARILVAGDLGAEAAGKFGAALDVTGQITGMLAGSIASIMGPAAIVAYRKSGPPGARRELTQGVTLFMAVLLPTVAGLIVTARPFAVVTSGHDFERMVGDLIPVLIVSRGLNVFSQFYLHLGFQIIEKPLRQVVCGSTTLVTNVLLNVILTRAYGLQGAAWALLIADAVGVAVSLVLLKPVFPMPFPGAALAKILGCVLVMVVGCELSQALLDLGPLATLLLTSALGAVLYAASGYAADVADARSKNLLSKGYVALAKLRR